MRLMNVAVVLAAGLMMAGCETTGAGAGAGGMNGLGSAIAQSAVAAGTQAAIGSAVPAAAAYAPGSYANDPVAIAYAQQQAARQGVTLTPEQAALALQMAEQQQAGGAGADASVMAEAAARQAAAAGFAQQAAAAGIPLGAAIMGQGAAAAATPAVATTVTPGVAPAAGVPDAQKSCEQLGAEIGEQQQIIAAANDSATNAQMLNAGVGIAQSLGMHFGGFGLGGIQAAGAAGNAAAQQGQAAQQQAQQAEIRLQVLTGFYQGKGCAA